MKKIFFICGDKSADLYAGMLAKTLNQKYPGIKLYSCGGKNLAAHSEQLINLVDHSVTGFVEVLAGLPNILKTFNNILAEIDRIKPDLVIPLDFPDFNLRLIEKLNRKYPIFYYISPQVWAWRQNRVEQIKKYTDKMIVLFKFEQEFYQKTGVTAEYFGHPLLEIIPDNAVPAKKIIALMPGSRRNEIKANLPVMLSACEILKREFPQYALRLIRPDNLPESFYRQIAPAIEITAHSYPVVAESAFILASSGTLTVELAILGIPFLIMYKVNSLSWMIAKLMVTSPLVREHGIGMVNILAGKKIIPEFLQNKATPENIAATAREFLFDKQKYQQTKLDLRTVKNSLTPIGATGQFAEHIGKYLKL